jgi:hypothetical protein
MIELLFLLLAAAGGAGVVFTFDKFIWPKVDPQATALLNPANKGFLYWIKLIALVAAGGFVVHFLLRLFKIKIFGRIVK